MSGKPRGFAAIDPALRREIARKGGRAAHAAGTAHEFTSEEAREAGRKGGAAHAVKVRLTEKGIEATNHVVLEAQAPLPERDDPHE